LEKNSDIGNSKGNGPKMALFLPQIPSNDWNNPHSFFIRKTHFEMLGHLEVKDILIYNLHISATPREHDGTIQIETMNKLIK